jgi:hypothetical protein
MSLWQQTRSQRWALLVGLLIGLVIGATVTLLFKPLIIGLIVLALGLLIYRVVRAVRGGGGAGDAEPRVRGMMVTGRYGETMRAGSTVDISGRNVDDDPVTVPRRAARASVREDKVEPVVATPEVRRGPEYDAEIDAILANIDRQIADEGAAPRRRPGTSPGPSDPSKPSRSDASRVQDADWSER